MKSDEYKKFLAEHIKRSEEDIKKGRTATPEEFYERAMNAIARAQQGMKRSA